MKSLALALAATVLGGCASIVNDSRQDVRVQTQSPDGHDISGAHCTLRNAREDLQATSGSTVRVYRSSDDLHIRCRHPDYPDCHRPRHFARQ